MKQYRFSRGEIVSHLWSYLMSASCNICNAICRGLYKISAKHTYQFQNQSYMFLQFYKGIFHIPLKEWQRWMKEMYNWPVRVAVCSVCKMSPALEQAGLEPAPCLSPPAVCLVAWLWPCREDRQKIEFCSSSMQRQINVSYILFSICHTAFDQSCSILVKGSALGTVGE